MQYLIEAEKKDHYIKAHIGCLYKLSKSSRKS